MPGKYDEKALLKILKADSKETLVQFSVNPQGLFTHVFTEESFKSRETASGTRDKDTTTTIHRTALHHAIQHEAANCIQWLLDQKAIDMRSMTTHTHVKSVEYEWGSSAVKSQKSTTQVIPTTCLQLAHAAAVKGAEWQAIIARIQQLQSSQTQHVVTPSVGF